MQVKSKNMMFAGLVVLLVGVLWYRVVYSSMESKASKAKSAAHDANTSADNLRQELKGASDAANKAKTKDPSINALLEAIPATSSEAAFLRSVDELRVSSGATWQSITPASSATTTGAAAPATVSGVTSITVGISVLGTEAEITRYLEGLAGLHRIFVADNVSVAQNGSNAAAGASGPSGPTFSGSQLTMTISGRIFTQPAAATAATGATVSTPAAAGTSNG